MPIITFSKKEYLVPQYILAQAIQTIEISPSKTGKFTILAYTCIPSIIVWSSSSFATFFLFVIKEYGLGFVFSPSLSPSNHRNLCFSINLIIIYLISHVDPIFPNNIMANSREPSNFSTQISILRGHQ